MIEIPARQQSVVREQVNDNHKQAALLPAEPTGFFSLVVALKSGGVSNLPQSDFAAVCPACQP
jgi:hypothetical protein